MTELKITQSFQNKVSLLNIKDVLNVILLKQRSLVSCNNCDDDDVCGCGTEIPGILDVKAAVPPPLSPR